MALACRLRADDDVDAAFGLHFDAGLLARRADRGLDVIGKAEAKQLAALFGLAAARRKSFPVGDLHRPVHIFFVAAGIVDHADGIAVRHVLRAHEVFAPQLDAVDAETFGGLVDQPLDGVSHFGPAGTAVGIGRHRVGEDGDGAQRRRRDGIGARNKPRALAQRRQRHAARADIADIGRAHREEAAVGVERKLDFGDEIAALIIAQERFRARRGEFHRPAELLRCPQHQAELDEDAVARAEIAADIVREDAQPVGRNAEHRGKLVLLPHRAAGAGIERVAAGRGIVMAERRARFERHAGDAADMEFLFHDMRRAGECPVGRLGIAEPRIDEHVVRNFIPDDRRARPHRVFGMQHEGQLLVLHLHRFGRVHRLRLGRGDHHGDGLADVARLVRGQQQMRTDENRAAARRGKLHVVFGLRQRIVRNGFEVVGRAVGAGVNAEHARHRLAPAPHRSRRCAHADKANAPSPHRPGHRY